MILGNLRETRKRFSEEAILDRLADSLREAFRPQLLLLLPGRGRRVPRCPPAPSRPRGPPAAAWPA